MNDMQKEKVRQMRIRGDSYGDISLATGLSAGTIKAYCSRNDIRLNPAASGLAVLWGLCRRGDNGHER